MTLPLALSMIPKDVMDRAISFGNAGHKVVELHAKKNLDVKALPEAIKPYYEQVLRWEEAYKPIYLAIEQRYVSQTFRFCGRPDIICRLGGELAIPDLKFTSQTYAYQALQTAGYEVLARENGYGKEKRIRRMVVRFEADRYEVIEHKDKNDRAYFLNCLSVTNFKMKHNLLKKGEPQDDK